MVIKEHIIRSLRERSGYTQAALAQAIGVSDMTVRRWESGQREPRASEIAKLCEVLGVSEAELLRGPAEEKIEVRLVMNFEPMKGGIMDMRGKNTFVLCLEGDKIGLTGAARFEDEADIDKFLVRAKAELMIGLKVRGERQALDAKGATA